jgi:NTP pyrophosphatase (non-canonical NTP hydrolase)
MNDNQTPAAGSFQCPQCCAPAGQPCAPGCTAGTLATAANITIGMLEVLDTAKLPLAVAASIGVLRCGLKEAQAERPAVLKGVGKINGDGWKDTTRIGEVVFVWNTEMPKPYKAGQYPRIGNQCGWTASTEQYNFSPATPEQARGAIEGMLSKARAGLSFSALRQANTLRLPQFKNPHGELAHQKPDGSDWSPSQWLQALVGELGEFANVRKKFERGDLTFEQYRTLAEKELADVQTYLDLLARRALDIGPNAHATGVDLGEATRQKFNEVSHRVGADVFIDDAGKVYGAQIAHEGGVA